MAREDEKLLCAVSLLIPLKGISSLWASNPESRGHSLCEIAGATICVCVCLCVRHRESHCAAPTHEMPYVSAQFAEEQIRCPFSQEFPQASVFSFALCVRGLLRQGTGDVIQVNYALKEKLHETPVYGVQAG